MRQAEVAKYREQSVTGLRVNRPSDDSTACAMARRMEGLNRRYEQYMDSITQARGWADHLQEDLDNLSDLFINAYEDAVQGMNDTLGQAERDEIASSVDTLLLEVVDVLNSQYNEDYLFAGTNTRTEPFTLDTVPTPPVVTYNGNNGALNRAIGPQTTVAVNISGDRVLDTGNGYTITESLTSLSDALRAGDTTQIEAALTQVQGSQDHLLSLSGEAGTIGNRLQVHEDQLSQAMITVERQRSRAEDADLAETLTKLQEAETGLQAALQIYASVQEITLLDFI